MMVRGYVCWLINDTDRESLMKVFPQEFVNLVAHHVTVMYDVDASTPLPQKARGRVVGEIIDKGVQALVVEVNGTTRRLDGEIYHITWSLDEGRFPEEARRLVRRGYFPIAQPVEIELTPAFVPSTK